MDRRRRCLRALTLLLAIQASACWEWRPSMVPPARLIQEEAPGRIRVTTRDGTTLVVYGPTTSGDSIEGRVTDAPARIAIADLQRLETRQLDTRNTIVVGILAGIFGYALVTACFGLVSPC